MRRYWIGLLGASCFAPSIKAEWTFVPAIDSGIIHQEAKTEISKGRSLDSISIEPSLIIDFNSRKFSGNWTMSHQHLIRDTDDSNFKDDFNTYQYEAELNLIDNLLHLRAFGGLNQLNLNPGDYLVNDRFSNPDELTKTRFNAAQLDLESQRGDYINVDSNIGLSDVDSEENSLSSFNLEGRSFEARAVITQGDYFKSSFFRITSSYAKTDSDTSDTQNNRRRADQTSRQSDLFFNQPVLGNLGIVLRGSNEGYQFDAAGGEKTRTFYSYGVGISLAQSPNRYVAMTYNTGKRDDAEHDYFVGGNLNWAFSGRTYVSGSYGKRYYGDSGNVTFSYASKHLRATFSYEEEVTNFSRLNSSEESLGLFVCPSNDLNISSCYQPNSLNVQLEPGEQFTEFSEFVVEVSDEPILMKRARAVLGYSKTRFSTALEFLYSNPFYEISKREQLSYTTNLSMNYELGPRTDFRTQLTYIEAYERPGDNGLGLRYDDTIVRAISAISYRLNENILADLELRFVDRDSDVDARNAADRRITASIKYTF